MISEFNFILRKRLHKRIEGEYDCVPQLVTKGNSLGFNVGGREVGRVEESDGHLHYIFYAKNSRPEFPVFS